jgi:hypothetical protein
VAIYLSIQEVPELTRYSKHSQVKAEAIRLAKKAMYREKGRFGRLLEAAEVTAIMALFTLIALLIGVSVFWISLIPPIVGIPYQQHRIQRMRRILRYMDDPELRELCLSERLTSA